MNSMSEARRRFSEAHQKVRSKRIWPQVGFELEGGLAKATSDSTDGEHQPATYRTIPAGLKFIIAQLIASFLPRNLSIQPHG